MVKSTISALRIYLLISCWSLNSLATVNEDSESIDKQSSVGKIVGIWGVKEPEIDYLFEHCNDLVCIMEIGGHFKKLNKKWEEALEWKTEELMAEPYMNFIHPDDRQRTLDYEKDFKPAGLVNRYRCKDGSYRWLEWILLPNLAEGHPTQQPISFARDITAWRNLE